MMVLGYGEKVNRMTDRAEIERLLNQTGRTLEGLPEFYPEEEQEAIFKKVAREHSRLWENVVLHQSDVIELLVGALRDALGKVPKNEKKATMEEKNNALKKAHIILEKLSEFNERNDNCDDCPFYDNECDGNPNHSCLSEDILLSYEAMLDKIGSMQGKEV
jgi:hypothetical protein